MSFRLSLLGVALALCAACQTPTEPKTPPPSAKAQQEPLAGYLPPDPRESRFAELRQLTFGGENAEAYWSFDGKKLVYQSHQGEGCDQIYVLSPFEPKSTPERVSTGKGATTCAYFLPGNQQMIYASTHLGGDACPPKPDRSQGYVWALYPSYDLFKARADGSSLERLTNTSGYDAEATVCAKDGSIVFTSVRDGDLELYRMDANGQNVRRLTNAPGYDGGAFFSADCEQIVWRASRPTGKALDEYRALLAKGLVRPTQLELWVAKADGSEARQITYLGAASFAPYFFPSGRRVIFSSNYGDPKGREFDLWAVDTDGTDLERITFASGFDGFPMFSPDGRYLAFGSNRANAPGSHDTNVFVATWAEEGSRPQPERAADRARRDVAWLADPARDGRGIETPGLDAAGRYIEQRFAQLGIEAAPDPFQVTTSLEVAPGTSLALNGKVVPAKAFRPLPFSGEGNASGRLVLAGHGIRDKALGVDDYKGVTAKDAIVVVRRFVPDSKPFESTETKRRAGDLRQKAWIARELGAKALLVVDAPERPARPPADWKAPDEAPFPTLHAEGPGDAGIPVVIVERDTFAPVLEQLEKRQPARAEVGVKLSRAQKTVFNVVARLIAASDTKETVVVGAHYDHLGRGGHPGSLAPDSDEPHVGADDNASGVAALLEVAKALADQRVTLKRNVVFVAFSAEESGDLGSSHFVKEPPPWLDPKQIVAMLNLDMVGRLRDNRLTVLGTESAKEWPALVSDACGELGITCDGTGDGYGPSDQTPFYAAGIPVLHFFTGAHADYHKPSDTVRHINAAGLARVAELAASLAANLATSNRKLSYLSGTGSAARGDLRSFNASLGTVPDYSGPPAGQKGVLLAGVRAGSAAEKGGLRRGDVLVRLGKHDVGDVRDLMYALNASKPGETVTAVVLREGKRVELSVTFEESRRPR